MKNLLIIEAHSDDSAISVSGFLEKNRGRYRYHFLLVALSSVQLHHAGLVSREQRQGEYESYVKHFDGVWHREGGLPFDADGLLDKMGKKVLISAIENIITAVEPSVLICQGPSFHQDHTMVYEATIAATRPTARFLPNEIYIMENPTYVHSLGPQTDMKPDLYVTLTEDDMRKKLDCFRSCFPTQIRDSVNYLSEDGIRTWGRYRGIEARCMYAEALKTYIRII
jgi:LmbE family N-acetylglucosaminyl deacetylase